MAMRRLSQQARRAALGAGAGAGLAGSLALSSPQAEGVGSQMSAISQRLAAIESALGISSAKEYVVQGSIEAAGLDLDFDLTMNADLANNEYPTAKMDAARAAEHTSLCAKICTPEVISPVGGACVVRCPISRASITPVLPRYK